MAIITIPFSSRNQSEGFEFDINLEPYFPGTLLMTISHKGRELACTVVSKASWRDALQRDSIIQEIGEHLYYTYFKPTKEGNHAF